jgi:hypothetical protein
MVGERIKNDTRQRIQNPRIRTVIVVVDSFWQGRIYRWDAALWCAPHLVVSSTP